MEVNVYLIVVIAILVCLTLIGRYRGFVKTVFATLGLVVVLILTAIFNPYIRSFVDNNADWKERTIKALSKSIEFDDEGSTGWSVSDYVSQMNIPDDIKKTLVSITEDQENLIEKVGQSTTDIKNKTKELVYEGLAELIIGAISYLITFCVASLVVLVIGLLLDIASKLPVIKQLNNFLGGIAGLVQGYIVVSLMYVIAVALGTTNIGMTVLEMIDKSEFLSWLYNHNVIVNFLMALFRA